jgi:hypothetical protein
MLYNNDICLQLHLVTFSKVKSIYNITNQKLTFVDIIQLIQGKKVYNFETCLQL